MSRHKIKNNNVKILNFTVNQSIRHNNRINHSELTVKEIMKKKMLLLYTDRVIGTTSSCPFYNLQMVKFGRTCIHAYNEFQFPQRNNVFVFFQTNEVIKRVPQSNRNAFPSTPRLLSRSIGNEV